MEHEGYPVEADKGLQPLAEKLAIKALDQLKDENPTRLTVSPKNAEGRLAILIERETRRIAPERQIMMSHWTGAGLVCILEFIDNEQKVGES